MQPRAILTLVRHGETSANVDRVWHGSIDSPLTERGALQASRVAHFIGERFGDSSAIYSSGLRRARMTAEAIGSALGLSPRIDLDLREYELGTWEGKRYSELARVHELWSHIKTDPDFAPHGGESPREVTDRFTAALRRIADRHPGERVIVVAHGGVLSMALGEILDGSYTKWFRVMENCAVSELVFEPEPELLSFNVTDHLDGV